MLASLHGSPQQPRGWDAFPPSNHSLSFPYDHTQLSEPVMQWQPSGHFKRSNEVARPEGGKRDRKKGASRMQVKREAQKAMLARSKSNNAANASYTMPPAAYPPLGFGPSQLGEGPAQCNSLKRKYDQALSPLEQHGSSKRSLMEPSWPVELTGLEDEQNVWRLRGGGHGGPDEHSEEPSAEAPPQRPSDGEGSTQAGQRVDALISEVASMMESAQRGAQPTEYLLRLNRLESIPSLPRFNSLELADEMFADILKWDLPKGEGRAVEVRDGEVIRTKGGGPEDDDTQAEEFLKCLDPSLANQEPGAIQDQLHLVEGDDKGGLVVRMQGGAKEEQGTGSQDDAAKIEAQNGDDSEKTQDDLPRDQEAQGFGEEGFGRRVEESKEGESAAELVQSDASKPAEPEEHPVKEVSINPPSPKPLTRSPKVADIGAKHRHFARPRIDVLAQASASLGPTSPVASKDSLESPESPIVSSLVGGAPRRPKFTPLQHEKLRALAGKAHWHWGAIEGTGEARQLCADLSIDAKQLKRWVDSHRPKELHQQPHPGVPFMGWGVPPAGMTNPGYMSYMAVNPMGYPAGWGGMPRPPPGDGPWMGGGPGMPAMGPPFHPPMQVPYTPPMIGPGFGPAPYAPGGAGFVPGGPGAALVAAADVSPDLDENQELVASAEALGKLLGDRVNTIPPEKLKEILAAWMAHKRNKREMEKASQQQLPAAVPSGGVKRKEPEPMPTPQPDEPSEGSLLQFSIPSLERGLSNAPSISTLLAEELVSAAAEEEGLQKEGDHRPAPVSPGAFKGQGGNRDSSLSVLLRDISGGAEQLPPRMMGPLERQVFGVDEDNMQMGPAAESGDDESASSSDEPGRPSRRRPGLRPRSKRRRVAESSGGEEEEEQEELQSEEMEDPGGALDEEEFPREHAGTGGQWTLASGLEDRRMPPPLGYQGHVGQTTVSAILFEKNLTASDTSHLGRWVLPKLAAERYMPYMEHRDGTFMLVEDSKGGRWCCKYRWWPNNKSKMYVLEQTGDIVKHFKLHPGDTIHFCQSIEGHLMIYEQKKGSKQRPPMPLAASPAPLPKRYAKRIPIEPKTSPKGARKTQKTPKGPRSPVAPAGGPFRAASYKLSGPFARVSTRGRTIRPSSRLRRGNIANPENGPPTLVYNASAGQDLAGRLVPFDGRGAAMLPPGGPVNKAVDPSEVGIDPWAGDELLSRGEPTAHINELARRFLSPDGSGRGTSPGGVPRPLARTGSADLANEILALTSSSREMGPRDLSPLGAVSRQGSLTPVLQRTKSQESLPFSVTNFPPIPTGLESLSRSSSLNRTASLARAGSLLSRLPSDLEALSKMDNFPSFDFAATPPLPVESAFQPYGATPGRGTIAGAPELVQNRRRAG